MDSVSQRTPAARAGANPADHALECDHRDAIQGQLGMLAEGYDDAALLLGVVTEIRARCNGMEAIARRRLAREGRRV